MVSQLFHATDDFMAGDEWQFRRRKFTINYMEVGPANGAGTHAHEELAGLRFRLWQFFRFQFLPRRLKDHGAHTNDYIVAAWCETEVCDWKMKALKLILYCAT
jgi:hypothetical protein